MLTRFRTETPRAEGSRRSLLVKATLPLVLAGVLLLTVGALAAWQVRRLHDQATRVLEANVSSIRAAEDFEGTLRLIRHHLHRASGGDRDHLDRAVELQRRADLRLDEMRRNALTGRELELVEQITPGYRRFVGSLRAVRDDPSGTSPADLERVAGLIPPDATDMAHEYVAANEGQIDEALRRNAEITRRLTAGLLLLGTSGAVAGLLAGYIIARGLRRSMVQLSLPIRDAAGRLGEVACPLTVVADPSFGDLERVLHELSHGVETVVDRLREREREVLRAEQLAALGQLAAGLAHELRNPLTSFKVIVQSAVEPSDLDRHDLRILREETARLEQSVQSFLDFARPSLPERRPTDLVELVEQVVSLVLPRAERRDVRVGLTSPDRSVLADVDAGQIRQVLLNLVLNALDSVGAGGTVDIEVGRRAASGGEGAAGEAPVVIRVSDDGGGLPAELGERIFEPFVSTKETGTGLGLPICRRIVESHGGRLSASDRPGGGAVFTVELPAGVRTGLSPVPERAPAPEGADLPSHT